MKEILPDVYNEVGEVQLKAIKEISTHIKEIRTLVDEMTEARKVANNSISNEVERAQVYSATVLPYLDKIRYHIDKEPFRTCLEKPRDFDPFGHAGLSPLVTI